MDQLIVKRFDVKPIMERAYCPDCDVELELDPVVLTTFPATYQYFCPNCGYGYQSNVKYPQVTFVDDYDLDIDS